jgi:hypothetical protein
LVVAIIALTVVIYTIAQFSLKKKERFALLINMFGKQRSLRQKVLRDFYERRMLKCNYAGMKLRLEHVYSTNLVLQKGNSRLEPLEDSEIQKNFDKLDADINYMYTSLKTWDSPEKVSIERLSNSVGRFISVMCII